jgi:hypothetical protein
MRRSHYLFALLLSFAIVLQVVPLGKACGPETLQPIFVFENSPDPPFQEFTEGKIGIVQPSFGRKTLVIAYRYLNGGSYSGEEQKALVEALKGKPPEGDGQSELKAWLAARKEILKDEEEPPTIYRQGEYGGYDFFPNCTANAFEVATETLKDRAARYGPDDPNVREWLNAQDTVFQNCAEGSHEPVAVGAESPLWLRKDRDYQIAASFFYSLQLDEARRRFELIAQDTESDWQQTADYLVGRTLVRQANLESNERTKRELNERAETYLLNLLGRASKFRSGTQKLIGLVKYRLHPEERVRELAQVMTQSGDENLRQDLIDYVWLLDKFDEQIRKAEEERQKVLNPEKSVSESPQIDPKQIQQQLEQQQNFQAVERGELIQVWLNPIADADGHFDQSSYRQFFFKPDVTAAEIYETFETALARKLSDAEVKQLEGRHADALRWRKWNLSPNRKFIRQPDYEGCDYECNHLTLDLLPPFLTMDELTDWIFTFQSDDPKAYQHALATWRQTQSDAWFVAALAKAPAKPSQSLQRLVMKAQTVKQDSPLFPTVAYNRIRLLGELGRKDEARKLLDQIIATDFDAFPLSAQNLFIAQRMHLAQNVSEFLRFAARKPVRFYEYGTMGTIPDLRVMEESSTEEQKTDPKRIERLEALWKWDGRSVFDDEVVDVLNWHFPLKALVAAAHDPALPDYLRQRVLLTVWTRATLLKSDDVAHQAATEIVAAGIDTNGVFSEYLKARTAAQKEDAATFALLKSPDLTPYVMPGVPDLDTDEDGDDLELAWWCTLPETTYNDEGKEVPRQVASPSFLPAEFRVAAEKERSELREIGGGKHYLGKKVIEWANKRPNDARLPEALFIAVMASLPYKYGCGGWEQDEEVREQATTLLKERYPISVWTMKLREIEQ